MTATLLADAESPLDAAMARSVRRGRTTNAAGSVNGLALLPRDRVDYSVTKGGMKIWGAVLVFILLCSGLYTVFSGVRDLEGFGAADYDGDGDFDNVSEGDDGEEFDMDDDGGRRGDDEQQRTPTRQPNGPRGAERASGERRASGGGDERQATDEDADDDDDRAAAAAIAAAAVVRSEKELLARLEERARQRADQNGVQLDDAPKPKDAPSKSKRQKESPPKAESVDSSDAEESHAEESHDEDDKGADANPSETSNPADDDPPEEIIKVRYVRRKGKAPVPKPKRAAEDAATETDEADSDESAPDDSEADISLPSTSKGGRLVEVGGVRIIRKRGHKSDAKRPAGTQLIPEPPPPAEEKPLVKVIRKKGKPATKQVEKEPRMGKSSSKKRETVELNVADSLEIDEDDSQVTVSVSRAAGLDTCEVGDTACQDERRPTVKTFRTKGKPKEHAATDDTAKAAAKSSSSDQTDFDDRPSETAQSKIPDNKKHSRYKKHAVTNRQDNAIRQTIDDAERLLDENNVGAAIDEFERLVKEHPQSPRCNFGKAKALEMQSAKKRSNPLLEEAIQSYEMILTLPDVPDELYILTTERLVDRARFRGWTAKAIQAQRRLIDRFPDNIDYKNDFGVSHLMMGRNDDARNIFSDVIRLDPTNGFALVHYGFILKTVDDDSEEAVKYLRRGIKTKEKGTQDGRFFYHLGDALQRLGRVHEASRLFEEGAEIGLFLSKYQRSLYNVNGLTARPWWTPEQTGYKKQLTDIEKEWLVIRKEALELLDLKSGGFSPEDEKLSKEGDWKQFMLYQKGQIIAANCQRAPKTCEIVARVAPDATSCKRGQIKFSVMLGGTSVWPHTGPTNCRLRAHLGLTVPPGASIRVADETRQWKEGKFIVLDDSFEHEVWHNGREPRVILIVDFWHPELTSEQRASLSPI